MDFSLKYWLLGLTLDLIHFWQTPNTFRWSKIILKITCFCKINFSPKRTIFMHHFNILCWTINFTVTEIKCWQIKFSLFFCFESPTFFDTVFCLLILMTGTGDSCRSFIYFYLIWSTFVRNKKESGRTGVNFTNLLSQSANVPIIIFLPHSVSPTKLWPTLPIQTARKYTQLLCYTLCAVRQ